MVYLNEFNWTLDDHLTALVLIILCFKFESCLMGDQNPSRQEKKKELFYSFKSMAGDFYSSVIGLFNSFCFFFLI